ncbi:MAG: YigZ family protein [Pseudomonadota bacterium]
MQSSIEFKSANGPPGLASTHPLNEDAAMITLRTPCEGLLEAKGSRFIATVAPIEQFDELLSASRVAHAKANHQVIAWRHVNEMGQLQELAKDDGEPTGTAGRPILQVLRGREWVQVGALVVRYFGGIKLGTGGLARAYAGAVGEALNNATPTPWLPEVQATLRAPFDTSATLEREVNGAEGVRILERHFASDGVHLRIAGPRPHIEALRERYGA